MGRAPLRYAQAATATTFARRDVDHLLLIGTVTSADSRTAAPLVYAHRTFGTHSAYAPKERLEVAQ
ncbi:hypothetical protein GCM10010329_30420 [Streptomyces spiroverticillatus]|uniref:Uncharacterized protein n=1 Tax=Streptomyces finlayi TaxID=67296 RepID=A0A919C9A1_9ACTN|nr:hypothetical protein [Streptomyces finlayi]GHA05828.1 hypothetical protein GCM10010329_30420 [Streptomyces spiroverticillatus]GHC89583.1 hypothetical protein GCM10010334_22830 [Streptomyces finlayi]